MFIENQKVVKKLDKVAKIEKKLSFCMQVINNFLTLCLQPQGRDPSLLYSHFSRGSRARFILQR